MNTIEDFDLTQTERDLRQHLYERIKRIIGDELDTMLIAKVPGNAMVMILSDVLLHCAANVVAANKRICAGDYARLAVNHFLQVRAETDADDREPVAAPPPSARRDDRRP